MKTKIQQIPHSVGLISFCLFFLLSFSQAQAEKLDLNMHNQLIKKLSSVLDLQESEKDSDAMVGKSKLKIRLADLLCERSRLLSIEEGGLGDQKFKDQISSDRKRALDLYQGSQLESSETEKNRIDLQSAHLHMMLGQKSQAAVLLKKLSLLKSDNEYKAQALMQLGDIAFAELKFTEAKKLFTDSLKIKANPRKNYASTRIAWCLLNLGQSLEAENKMVVILRGNSKESQAFLEEASHDLATFMARNDVSEKKIQTLKQLSPENVRSANLTYLAMELDRTSKKQGALLVWRHVSKDSTSFMDQVEKQIHITRIQYDMGNKKQTNQELKFALQLVNDRKCLKEQECVVQTQNLRSIITDWGKAEEREPSSELVQAYSLYLDIFEDYEMAFWAGHAALKTKQYPQAVQLFKMASSSGALLQKIKKTDDQNPATKQASRIFEGSLLSGIEAAELSKDPNLQLATYQHYLRLNPDGAKAFDVRYQMAKLYYDQNNYVQSSSQFRSLSLDEKAPYNLRDKSSELYFDTLVLQKDEAKIESESVVFAQSLPSKKEQFLTLWRKSILNQAVTAIRAPEGSNLQHQSDKLSQINLSYWPAGDRKKLIQNKMVLSFKLKDLKGVEIANRQFLAEKDLSKQDQNEALQTLAWAQEMRFDFTSALATLQKVQVEKSQISNHEFKLALLSELSHRNPSVHYEKVLMYSKGGPNAEFAAHQLILAAKKSSGRSPAKIFARYFNLLQKNPGLFSSATMHVYEQEPDASAVKRALKVPGLRNSAEGVLISNRLLENDFKFLFAKLKKQKINASGDQVLRQSLKRRLQTMRDLENQIQKAIRMKSLTYQLIGLTELAETNARLSLEILRLPMPRGLKKNDRIVYQETLNQQVAPYKQQAALYHQKAISLWQSAQEKEYITDLTDWSFQSERPGSKLAKREVEIVRANVLKLKQSVEPLINFSEQRHKVASRALELQKQLQRNPFDIKGLVKLRELQISLGSGPMVAYLNTRLSELNTTRGVN